MWIFDILAPLIGLAAVVFLLSQCLLPEIAGTPWFPMVRRVWKLRKQISEQEEKDEELSLEQHLSDMRRVNQKQYQKSKVNERGETNADSNAAKTESK